MDRGTEHDDAEEGAERKQRHAPHRGIGHPGIADALDPAGSGEGYYHAEGGQMPREDAALATEALA
jgi:hypothetical protein